MPAAIKHTRQPTPNFRVVPIPDRVPKATTRFDQANGRGTGKYYYDMIMKSAEKIEENLRICRGVGADSSKAKTKVRSDEPLGNIFSCIDDTSLFDAISPRLDESNDAESSFGRNRSPTLEGPEPAAGMASCPRESIGRPESVAEAREELSVVHRDALTEAADEESEREGASFCSLSEVPGEIKGRLKDKKYEYSHVSNN